MSRIADLKTNYKKYLLDTVKTEDIFGNASLYFHRKTLEVAKTKFLSDEHIELVYATLVAWGMDGQKAKLPTFEDFYKSIDAIKYSLIKLNGLHIEKLNESEFENVLNILTDICFKINASTTKSKVVACTKTLAHILPDLVPPMDRQYTLKFFGGSWNQSKDKEQAQKDFFEKVMRNMYDFLKENKIVKDMKDAAYWGIASNTSLPKMFDNFIIVYVKANKL